MGTMPKRFWQDMTTEEFAALDASRVIAILPVGAIEQHGPHLPVYVDACINQGVVARAVEMMPDDLPVTVLPMMPVGKSNEHLAFPGTLTLSAETLTRLWFEIGESVHRAGVRKMVIFNSHGGQPQVAEIVARELRVRHGMLVVPTMWSRIGMPDGLYPADERRHGIHGGTVETSVMLHLRPDLVHMDKARNFEPVTVAMAREYEILSATGAAGFGWQAQDLTPDGAAGDASAADAERGQQTVDHAAQRFIQLLQEIDRLPMETLRIRTVD